MLKPCRSLVSKSYVNRLTSCTGCGVAVQHAQPSYLEPSTSDTEWNLQNGPFCPAQGMKKKALHTRQCPHFVNNVIHRVLAGDSPAIRSPPLTHVPQTSNFTHLLQPLPIRFGQL